MAEQKWDGQPPDINKTGWHWLKRRNGGDVSPWLWEADVGGPGCGEWATDGEYDPDYMARQFIYVAPCVPPA
jgi:hypothetical protein